MILRVFAGDGEQTIEYRSIDYVAARFSICRFLLAAQGWPKERASRRQMPYHAAMTGLGILLAIVLVAAYVNDSWRSLERARVLALVVCQRNAVQLLDGSVVRTQLRVERDGRWMVFLRTYRFEFTTDGTQRFSGHLMQRGQRVQWVSMEDPAGGRVLDVSSVAERSQQEDG